MVLKVQELAPQLIKGVPAWSTHVEATKDVPAAIGLRLWKRCENDRRTMKEISHLSGNRIIKNG